jgi:hypothetical protein
MTLGLRECPLMTSLKEALCRVRMMTRCVLNIIHIVLLFIWLQEMASAAGSDNEDEENEDDEDIGDDQSFASVDDLEGLFSPYSIHYLTH